MIRTAAAEDLPAIVSIYNQAIDAGFQTAFTEHITVAERVGWFMEHTPEAYPLYVYEQDGAVAGWLSVSPYRQGRAALRHTAEISYFLKAGYQGRGIGSALLAHALEECSWLGLKVLLAIILERNAASIGLMKKYGFEQWAHLPGVAVFDGVECGQVYYGIRL